MDLLSDMQLIAGMVNMIHYGLAVVGHAKFGRKDHFEIRYSHDCAHLVNQTIYFTKT